MVKECKTIGLDRFTEQRLFRGESIHDDLPEETDKPVKPKGETKEPDETLE